MSFKEAKAVYQKGMENVKNNPPPKGQKFMQGDRVFINIGPNDHMTYFPNHKKATVEYTYAHAYGGNDITSYCLDVDGEGSIAWFDEHQLTKLER